jgi:hypothetical protein
MADRKLLFAELAGIFLLWAEEVPGANPPWKGNVLRRARKSAIEDSGGQLIEFTAPATLETFVARSEQTAVDALKVTILNSPAYNEYAHRLGELHWQEFTGSEGDWKELCQRAAAVHSVTAGR